MSRWFLYVQQRTGSDVFAEVSSAQISHPSVLVLTGKVVYPARRRREEKTSKKKMLDLHLLEQHLERRPRSAEGFPDIQKVN